MLRPLLIALLLGPVLAAFAQSDAPLPAPPSIAAKTWLLMDVQSGQILVSRDADARVEPASLTKLMSAYLVFSALQQKSLVLDQPLPVSVKAWKMKGSRTFLEPNSKVEVDQLLRGMIVQSGNDATVTLAEGVAGSEEQFVQAMNEQAKRLGMTGTRFANATGLSNTQHYATTADLAKLAVALMRDFPQYYPLYSLREFIYRGINQANRNWLLGRDPNVDGVKTGYTEDAGYCLIASARRGERRLLAIVTGAASENARAVEAQKLLNYGFQHFDGVRLYEKGAAVTMLPVYKGSEDRVKAGVEQDVWVTVPRGRRDGLKAKLETMQPLLAPIGRLQQLGSLTVTYEGKPVGQYPVVALEQVDTASFLGRAWDGIRLWFE